MLTFWVLYDRPKQTVLTERVLAQVPLLFATKAEAIGYKGKSPYAADNQPFEVTVQFVRPSAVSE